MTKPNGGCIDLGGCGDYLMSLLVTIAGALMVIVLSGVWR